MFPFPKPLGNQVCLGLCFAVSIFPLIATSEPINEIQASARKWIDIEKEKTRLESDWQWQKTLLESTAKGLETRGNELTVEREKLEIEQATSRSEVQTLEEDAQQLNHEFEATNQHIQTSIQQLIRMRPLLPPQLSQSLELAYRNLDESNLSLSEKLQQVVTIINRCAQFNHTVTYSEEVVQLSEASSGSVMKVVYWGLSHAYALDPQSGKTYMGKARKHEWGWESQPGIGDSLDSLIAILNEEEDPKFINVPLQIEVAEKEVGS